MRLDTRTGYTRKPSTYDAALTEVGRGTPMGELMRRYWHPVGLVADAGTTPEAGARVRRRPRSCSATARAGLAWSWRAAAIAAPRSTMAGSRSAASAAAITAGCSTWKAIAWSSRASPAAAASASASASPGIRCEERYGLIWAYMGPPEKKPLLPRYECSRMLDDGRDDRGRRHQLRRSGGGSDRAVQLAAALREHHGPVPRPDPARRVQRRAVRRPDGVMPKVEWEYTPTA